MFNESWIRFAVLMVIFGAVLRSDALIVLATLLLTVIPIAWAWNRISLWRVSYERKMSEQRAFVGETITLSLRANNRKLLPLAWIKIEDQIPVALTPTAQTLTPLATPLSGYLTLRAALGPFERARWEFAIPCRRRGFYTIGPARLKSGDLFGLFERQWTNPRTDRLIVYPEVKPMEEWGLPPKDPLGDSKARMSLLSDPTRPRGVREYTPEDPLKHIHWGATARLGKLQVKLYEPTITYQWILFVNIATFRLAWQGVNSELLERVISLAASIANYAAERKYAVGILANGTWPESDQRLKILPGRDPNHLRHVLEALAAATSFVTTPIEKLLRTETAKLPWGATFVVISGVVTDELYAETLRLRRFGRRMALISLDEDWTPPDDLEGITVRQAAVK